MKTTLDRRASPRLRLSYPIRLLDVDLRKELIADRTVTQDVSARGAYLRTYCSQSLRSGRRVAVVVSVPHRLNGEQRLRELCLRTSATVVRLDDPGARGFHGEDGRPLVGVALHFAAPLRFDPGSL